MRWFEYSFQCQCGESEEGIIPSVERCNIRCPLCSRYQRPELYNLLTDELDYDEYLEEMYDEDWDEDEEE